MKHIIFSLCIIFLIIGVSSAQEDCGLAPQLTIGSHAIITPGASNNVRDAASASASLVGRLEELTVITVLEGAICSGGFTWWQVESGDITGWTVESNSSEYFVLPLDGTVIQDVGIVISLPEGIADAVTVDFIVAERSESNSDVIYFPAYRSITLEGYENSSETRDAEIRIIALSDFEALDSNSMARGTADFVFPDLLDLIENETPIDSISVQDFPDFYPGAANITLAHSLYLDTFNASGIRFITAYAQDYLDPTNERLVYRYLGFSDDENFFIDVLIPIDAPSVPEAFDRRAAGAAEDNGYLMYQDYREEARAFFNAIDASAFTPNLLLLDELIASLVVQPYDAEEE